MKSKASLLLMELLVMVLVFALAAAICLNCFVKAETISRQTRHREQAVVIAQNAAEQLKAGRVPKTEQGEYTLQLLQLDPEFPDLGKTQITVYLEETELFSLTVGYWEVAP